MPAGPQVTINKENLEEALLGNIREAEDTLLGIHNGNMPELYEEFITLVSEYFKQHYEQSFDIDEKLIGYSQKIYGGFTVVGQ
jgi:hypothetical protein